MKIELTAAEFCLVISALDVASYEECDEEYEDLAEKLRARRDKAKELAAKKSLDWTGGDL